MDGKFVYVNMLKCIAGLFLYEQNLCINPKP